MCAVVDAIDTLGIKKKMLSFSLVTLFLWGFLTSCSSVTNPVEIAQPEPSFSATAQYVLDHSQHYPLFVSQIQPAPASLIENNSLICIWVNPSLVQRGNLSASDLKAYITSSMRLSINGRNFTHSYITELSTVADQSGNFTNAFGGNLEFCYEPLLERGYHLFELIYEQIDHSTIHFS